MDEKKKIETERAALNALLEKGLAFEIPRRSFFGVKRKPRTFVISQPYLGTLDSLSSELLRMDLDEEAIKKDPLGESRRIAYTNARRAAKVVAIAVLNGKWRIRLFTRIVANYFLWKITPSKLFQLAMIINTMSNTADFTNSIRLLSIARITADPKADRVE